MRASAQHMHTDEAVLSSYYGMNHTDVNVIDSLAVPCTELCTAKVRHAYLAVLTWRKLLVLIYA